jgi:hypothetical protein
MIIWSGWGFLVAIIVIINTLLGKAIFGSITGGPTMVLKICSVPRYRSKDSLTQKSINNYNNCD